MPNPVLQGGPAAAAAAGSKRTPSRRRLGRTQSRRRPGRTQSRRRPGRTSSSRRPLARNIGEFGPHAEQWLLAGGAGPEPDWAAIEQARQAAPGADATLGLPDAAAKPLLAPVVLRELAALADAFAAGSVSQPRRMTPSQLAVAASSTPADAKLVLDNRSAQRLVGAPAWKQLLRLLGSPQPGVVVLRRTVPAPGAPAAAIAFHTDAARRTVQVPVTGDADIDGGRLVFVLEGRPAFATRAPGVPIVHGNAVVHGVTAHAAGVRCALYLLAGDGA